MVTKVEIKDNTKSPFHYLPDIAKFHNGATFEFNPGVNIIVGENGSGKSTLMNLIKTYLCVDFQECSTGMYNSALNKLRRSIGDDLYEGVSVYADYKKNTFRLAQSSELYGEDKVGNMKNFALYMEQSRSSAGEAILVSISALLQKMFSKDVQLTFDYEKASKSFSQYRDYIQAHRVEDCADEYTVLMDEPDKNLSLENIKQVADILSFHKEHMQIIAVVHNPIVIYKLSRFKSINFIEMTDDYVNTLVRTVNSLSRGL